MQSAFYAKNPFKNLKYCIQRIKRGYCDADLWDMDRWFLSLIVPMLRQFGDTQVGWPAWVEQQCAAEAGAGADDEEVDKLCAQTWKATINQLASDFETLEKMCMEDGDPTQRETLKNACFNSFSEMFFDLWD